MKDHPLNFKVSDATAKKFQEVMNKLESDNQTETQEIIIDLAYTIIKNEGIGKLIGYLRK
ncbi:MAG: hypothetical protein IE909_18450 [Campylobacterales bacterium]|nr:hypothetical protein [Campylobacterales bacterium]